MSRLLRSKNLSIYVALLIAGGITFAAMQVSNVLVRADVAAVYEAHEELEKSVKENANYVPREIMARAEFTVHDDAPASEQFAVTGLPEGVTIRFEPSGCAPGLGSCSVQMIITAAGDAPPTEKPALVTFTATSRAWGMSKTKSFLLEVGARLPSIDLKVNGSDGPVKLSRGTNGNLVANVQVAEGKSFDALLEWESKKTTGVVECFASQSAGDSFEGKRDPNGTEIVRGIIKDDMFTVRCEDNKGRFEDSVEVRLIGKDPVFEEF